MEYTFLLPKEILAHIFSFLDPKEKLNASSTCKHWIQVVKDFPSLLDDVCLVLMGLSVKYALMGIPTLSRPFSNFHLMHVIFDEERYNFIDNLAPKFRRLILNRCTLHLDIDQLHRWLRNCTNLVELKVWGCKMIRGFSCQPKLKNLHFEISTHYSMQDMDHIQKIVPLSLTHFGVVDYGDRHVDCIREFYEEMEDFIQKRRLSLQSLDFSGMWISNKILKNISQIEDLRLKRLRVSASALLTHSGLEAFCKLQQGIVALELGDCICDIRISQNYDYTIKDETVLMICTTLPQLKELTLSCCIAINESVVNIFQLKRLWNLSLYRCRGIDQTSFHKAVEGLECRGLKVLNICATLIKPETVTKLLQLAPNLREMILSEWNYLSSDWVEVPMHSYVRLESEKKFRRKGNLNLLNI